MPCRIAYLFSRYPVVSQTFCDSEMLALEALGFELEVVSLNPPPDSFRHERLDRLHAEIHYPPPEVVRDVAAQSAEFEHALGAMVADHDARYGLHFKAQIRARNAWQVAARLRDLGVSHVHVHFANRATHTVLFLKRLGFTFSFTAHAQDFMVDLGSEELLQEMVREASFVVAVSDFSRQLLSQMCPGHEEKLVRIYNGIELDDFTAAQVTEGDKLRLVSVGRLIEFKGFQHLIGAVKWLKGRGIPVEARIIGDGPLRASLEALVDSLELQEEVKLLGSRSQEEIKRELAQAQVFVHPAIIDSKGASDILPTVITEAMACCLPVVSTTVAGIPEMVVHGETGWLTEPGNEEQLGGTLEVLWNDPLLRQEWGQAGRKRAETRFRLMGEEAEGGGTAAQLAAWFEGTACADSHAQVQVNRLEAPVAYWIEAEDLQAIEDLPADERLRCIVSTATKQMELPTQALWVEYLPDAVVLESFWLRRPAWRQQLEKLRSFFGESLSSEVFYRDARRAIWLAEMLPRRGVKLLHAFRSNAVLTVYLWHRLTGLPISVAIEENPALSRSLLKKLLGEVVCASISDPKLRELADGGDVLMLQQAPTHKAVQLGPLRLKQRVKAASVDRRPLEQSWFERLLQVVDD